MIRLNKRNIFIGTITLLFVTVLIFNIEFIYKNENNSLNNNNQEIITETNKKSLQNYEEKTTPKPTSTRPTNPPKLTQPPPTKNTVTKGTAPPGPKDNSVYCDNGIDVVITWVNGSDPKLIEDRIARNKQFSTEALSAAEMAQRFRDLDGLKYTLRSIQQYAPWVRKVWIVTAQQIPTWFDTTYKGNIEFIYHKELFLNKSDLPNFNSNSIEASFHNLPERVSDCFLSLNDDIFFGGNVEKKDFFDSNKIAVYPESWTAPSSQKDIWHRTIAYSSKLLDTKWNDVSRRKYMTHGVQPMYRKSLQLMYSQLQLENNKTTAHPFRNETDIQIPFLNQHYNLKYFQTYQPTKINQYGAFRDSEKEMKSLFERLTKYKYKTVCLNDNLSDKPPSAVLTQIHQFFEAYFPKVGEWELK
ncbi:putative glycophosphotransferase [Tieghemostelium lacteum]|uniref:Putative glycophosphotransferase n=1 Tax=Tieghemostelium lacteum TaxID=361077 RepID=A0A152A9D8_TIELA|nr:putative glycophosphotransferase [Tieghemostelium lacteum]|eukprot:KYR02838.1 putative glycophosphotransferase [Tieghemostelium lacteum]